MKLLQVTNNSKEHEQLLSWHKSYECETQSFPPAPGHACGRALVSERRGSARRQEHRQVCQDQMKPNGGDTDYGALKAAVFPFALDPVL